GAHALKPRDAVGLGEREDVPDVQLSADRQRGSVDGEDIAARGSAVKLVLRPRLPTGETTCPRCRQAKACPAQGWRWGGIRYSWRKGSVRARLAQNGLLLGPVRAAEHPAQALVQRVADLGQRPHPVHGGCVRRRQSGVGSLAASALARQHRTLRIVISSI